MPHFNPHAYGPAFAPLLVGDRRRPLGPGTPDSAARPALEALSANAAFAHSCGVADPDMAACCIAAVWLLGDWLDKSHTISQGIETKSGSYWHGILHRREGDFSNAKYWFRHVGRHPVFDALGRRAAELAAAQGQQHDARSITAGGWDPFAFVDLCQAAVQGRSSAGEACLDIQQAEWELLFDHCYRAAAGS